MAMTITVPDNLEIQLQRQAKAQHRSAEDVALGILHDALEGKAVLLPNRGCCCHDQSSTPESSEHSSSPWFTC